MKNSKKGSLQTAVGALCFAIQSTLLHLGGSNWEIAGTARCFGLFFLAFFQEGWGVFRGMTFNKWVVGMLAPACGFLFPMSFAFADTATAISVSYSGMILRPFVDWVWEGAAVTKRNIRLLIAAAAGVICVSAGSPNSGKAQLIGVVAALLAAGSWMFFASKHKAMGSPVGMLGPTNLVAGVLGVIYLVLRGHAVLPFLLPNAIIGVTSSTGFLLFAKGNKHISATTSSLISMLEVPGAIVCTWYFVGEHVTALQIFGSILIVATNAVRVLTEPRTAQ